MESSISERTGRGCTALATKAARSFGRLSLSCCLTLPFVGATSLEAQRIPVPESPERQRPPVEHRVAGRVVRPAGDRMSGVPGAWVTLHRVGGGGGAPVDSMRTGADGSYAFRYMPPPNDDEMFFLSASYGGIAYFSAPLTAPVVAGDAAEIVVFDTTSVRVPLQVRGRHLVVGPAAAGEREVIEVYELSNDSSVTAIARDTVTPTWSAVLPDRAHDFAVGESDVAAAAVQFDGGRLRVFAPIAPGLKQIAISYSLPADVFPLSLPVGANTSVLEVLVEDPAGRAEGAGLAEVDPVSAEGRTFRRFLASDAPESAVIQLHMPAAPRLGRGTYLAIVLLAIGTAMLIVLARSFARRRPATPWAGRADLPDDPDRLAREVAALDAAFERMPSPTDEARAAYAARRADLKLRLAAALAVRKVRR